MSMFEASPKRNWGSLTTIVFVFFLMVSLGFFLAIYQQFSKEDPDTSMTINLGAIWTFLLLIWLGVRWRYKQAKKKDANRIKGN